MILEWSISGAFVTTTHAWGEIRDPLKELRVIHPHERPKQRWPQDAEPALARFGVMELINP